MLSGQLRLTDPKKTKPRLRRKWRKFGDLVGRLPASKRIRATPLTQEQREGRAAIRKAKQLRLKQKRAAAAAAQKGVQRGSAMG